MFEILLFSNFCNISLHRYQQNYNVKRVVWFRILHKYIDIYIDFWFLEFWLNQISWSSGLFQGTLIHTIIINTHCNNPVSDESGLLPSNRRNNRVVTYYKKRAIPMPGTEDSLPIVFAHRNLRHQSNCFLLPQLPMRASLYDSSQCKILKSFIINIFDMLLQLIKI